MFNETFVELEEQVGRVEEGSEITKQAEVQISKGVMISGERTGAKVRGVKGG